MSIELAKAFPDLEFVVQDFEDLKSSTMTFRVIQSPKEGVKGANGGSLTSPTPK